MKFLKRNNLMIFFLILLSQVFATASAETLSVTKEDMSFWNGVYKQNQGKSGLTVQLKFSKCETGLCEFDAGATTNYFFGEQQSTGGCTASKPDEMKFLSSSKVSMNWHKKQLGKTDLICQVEFQKKTDKIITLTSSSECETFFCMSTSSLRFMNGNFHKRPTASMKH